MDIFFSFSVKAGEYLQEIDETLFRDIAESGLVGILQRNTDAACQEAFPQCSTNNATVHSSEGPFINYVRQKGGGGVTLTEECIHTARFLVRCFGLYSPNH